MAAANKTLEYCVKNLTQCPVCLSDISNPTSLPCLHTFCMNCLQTICTHTRGNDVTCPVCRKGYPISQSGAGAFQHNFFIQSLLDAKSCLQVKPVCDACTNVDGQGAGSANVPKATVFCVNCSQKLCDRCSIPHKRMPGGSHQIKQLGDGFELDLVRLRANYCLQHKDELVKLYCFKCQVDMCLMCAAVHHRNHECKEISHVAEDFKQRMNDIVGKVTTKAVDIQNKLKVLDVDIVKFLSSNDAAEKHIKKAGEDMKQLIDAQVSKLLSELAAGKVKELKKFEEKRDAYELAKITLESFSAYACELKAKGSSSDIARAAKELEARANELLQAEVASHRGTNVIFNATVMPASEILVGKITTELSNDLPAVPSAPVNVQCFNNQIYWEKPLNDGSSPVIEYIIEKQTTGKMKSVDWSICHRVPANKKTATQVAIESLGENYARSYYARNGSPYAYRVRAVNKEGPGDPVLLPVPVQKSGFPPQQWD